MAPHVRAGTQGVSCRVVFQPGAGGWEASRPIFLAAFDLQTAESELQNWPGELEKQLEFVPSSLLSRTALLGFRSVCWCPFRRSGSPGPARVSWQRPETTRPRRCVGRRCPALLRGRTSAQRGCGRWETVPGAGSHPVEAQSQAQCDGQHQQRAAGSEGRPREAGVHASESLQTQQDAARFGWGQCFWISSPLRVDTCRRGTWALVKEASLRPSGSSRGSTS